MALDWERQAVIDELTQSITQGAFNDNYERLTQVLNASDALTELDRQRVIQFWLSKERERERGSPGTGL
jgi:hypothetical protein